LITERRVADSAVALSAVGALVSNEPPAITSTNDL
jgi:hypothetical protein